MAEMKKEEGEGKGERDEKDKKRENAPDYQVKDREQMELPYSAGTLW